MKIDKFTGINNTATPERLPLGTTVEATNVVVNGDGQMVRRPGAQILNPITTIASYGTFDQRQMFFVTTDRGIYRFDGTDTQLVGQVHHDAPCFWAEESGSKVFVAQRDAIWVWSGVQFEPLDNTVVGLTTGTKPLQVPGDIIRINWVAGRLCVASYLDGFTRLTFSVPGLYGRVSITEDWIEIPHLVSGLESFGTDLIISCTDAVFLYNTATGMLIKKLEYGTPLGRPIARNGSSNAFIWTKRGVVEYPSWENVTIKNVLVPPGEGCGSAVMQYGGNEYLVVSNDQLGFSYDSGVAQ